VPIRELLRVHLELAGFNVEEVGDGRAALNRARAEPFDLVIVRGEAVDLTKQEFDPLYLLARPRSASRRNPQPRLRQRRSARRALIPLLV
jgi:CheY-like chemotaxis protein